MKYSPTLRKLWKVNPDYESRYVLNAIYLDCEHGCAVATDGHGMAIVDATALIEQGEASFLIPVDALKAADRLLNKVIQSAGLKKKNKPDVTVNIRAAGDAVTVSSPLTRRSETFDKLSGQFPQWDKVIPSAGDGWHQVCIDASLLLRLAEALDGQRKEQGVTLFVKGESDAIVVAPTGPRFLQSVGILMPRRDLGQFPKPFWKKPAAQEQPKSEETVQATA
jgi:hypothetical protein